MEILIVKTFIFYMALVGSISLIDQIIANIFIVWKSMVDNKPMNKQTIVPVGHAMICIVLWCAFYFIVNFK